MEQDAGSGYRYVRRESNLKHVLCGSVYEGYFLTRIQQGGWCGLHCANLATTAVPHLLFDGGLDGLPTARVQRGSSETARCT